MSHALVEGFAADAIALARHLAGAGDDVRLAGPGPGPPPTECDELVALGIRVDPHTDLDLDDTVPDVAFLDVWTPEVAPRVARLRASGVRLSCLSELVLACSTVPTIGVTGTAGKTTTSSFLAQLLRAAGVRALTADAGYAGQLWATPELLAAVEPDAPTRHDVVVLELTSSHLAFCSTSPTVAVITSFWPDHLELHGSLDAYRSAKQRIVATQRVGDRVVVNLDDPAAACFAERTPAERWTYSAAREVERGAFLRGTVVARTDQEDVELGDASDQLGGRHLAVLGAVAAALAADVPPRALGGALDGLVPPRFRAQVVGRRGATLLVDDGMAATPAKAAATLRSFPERSVVLVAGGESERDGLQLHATAAEQELLERALDEVARAARHVVAFGPAASELAARLAVRGTPTSRDKSVDAAIERALEEISSGTSAAAVVVAPMFALTLPERERVATALRAAADR
jgi:UDP-N-acetylmuramoylalanine--D-glutamate ligase